MKKGEAKQCSENAKFEPLNAETMSKIIVRKKSKRSFRPLCFCFFFKWKCADSLKSSFALVTRNKFHVTSNSCSAHVKRFSQSAVEIQMRYI